MDRKEQAKEEISALVEEARAILTKLLDKNDEKYGLHWDYQEWYSKAIKAVEVLAQDRYEEFRRYYEIDPKRKSLGYGTYVIQDYLKGVVPRKMTHPNFDSKSQAAQCLYNQLTILNGLANRVDSVLSDLEAELYIEIKDAELQTAHELIKSNIRAAGALAGVVLEGYLKKVCSSHGIKFRKKAPTISDFNDALKKGSVYSTPTWRKISFLGDLRNLCSHKKSNEPTREQVEELISGVDWVTKNIF